MAAIFCVVLLSPPYARPAPETEQLIVFVQPDVSPVAKSFQQHRLPQIRKLAQTLGVDLHVVDARKGSPSTVGITPLIVYQNHRGRSIYQGRTTTPERVRNFIRTSRFVPQGKEPNRRESIPVWQEGRARVWAPLKVAAVTGSPPKDYNNDIFVAKALENIKKGFKNFRIQKTVNLGRADRGFYMDFNPWLSSDGTLYLSLVLFSQFDCKAPVFQKKIKITAICSNRPPALWKIPLPGLYRTLQAETALIRWGKIRLKQAGKTSDFHCPRLLKKKLLT
jgi:hypothetical protein